MTPAFQAALAGWKARGGIYFGESAGFGDCRNSIVFLWPDFSAVDPSQSPLPQIIHD